MELKFLDANGNEVYKRFRVRNAIEGRDVACVFMFTSRAEKAVVVYNSGLERDVTPPARRRATW